jgi:hypothetical protein
MTSLRRAALAAVCLLAFPALAVAQTGTGGATGPQPSIFTDLASLYGPACGIIVALVIFFDRLAKVIPNSTDIKALAFLRKVAAVLGAKVPDVQ